MFEFRRDPATGAFILLEVNARFWGSLPLALAAGADFPAAAAALHTGATPRPERRYRAGIVLRDLGGEYYRVLKEAEKASGAAARLRLLASGLGRLALALPRARGFDSFAADDPEPWRRDRAELARTIARAAARRLPQDRRRRARAAVRRLADRLAAGRRQVVMLCHGNICRSPFAEHVLRDKAARAGVALDIVSAGTIGLEGRASPADAVAAARAYGTDLRPHRSRFLDVEAARAAGAVIVFDDRNVDELRRLGLNGDINLLRLADFTGRREIGDPYGHGAGGFAAAYAQIDEAVTRLVAGLAATGGGR
jgi:protein-tyrosine-phosphatase